MSPERTDFDFIPSPTCARRRVSRPTAACGGSWAEMGDGTLRGFCQTDVSKEHLRGRDSMNITEHNQNGLVYLTADGFDAALQVRTALLDEQFAGVKR